MHQRRAKALNEQVKNFEKHINHVITAKGHKPGTLKRVYIDPHEAVILVVYSDKFPQMVYADTYPLTCSCGEGHQ